MSHHHHDPVSTGTDGKKHLTVLSNMDSATVRKLHREYIMPSTFHYYACLLYTSRCV